MLLGVVDYGTYTTARQMVDHLIDSYKNAMAQTTRSQTVLDPYKTRDSAAH